MDRRLSSASSASSSSTVQDEKETFRNNGLYDHQRLRSHIRSGRTRALIAAAASLGLLSVFGLLAFAVWRPQIEAERIVKTQWIKEKLPPPELPYVKQDLPRIARPLDPLAVLNGPPTTRFRDNLRSDTQYITSWVSAGWTNDVMTYANLIYLGIITNRVPVVGDFVPSHVGGNVAAIPFSEVFDLPRLRRLLSMSVLEWREVKDPDSLQFEEIGCWGVWQSVQDDDRKPRHSVSQDFTRLDVSVTQTPDWVKLIPHYEHDKTAKFWALASLAFPEERVKALAMTTPQPAPLSGAQLPPDDQMLCYDYLYYAAAFKPNEFDYDYSPAWRTVAQHMHWAPQLHETAMFYVRHALDIPVNEVIPPFITIHMRRGDFAQYCGTTPLSDCYASIPVIARRVEEVRQELLETKGFDVKRVIMTSDERNATWWDEVKEQGWYAIDHSHTRELHGAWYPVLIDAVIQSSGHGFVGTDVSTMSTLARRRVESWQHGVTRTVKWRTPTADHH